MIKNKNYTFVVHDNLWFCGKHRRFITEHTLAKDLYQKCNDYEEVKK